MKWAKKECRIMKTVETRTRIDLGKRKEPTKKAHFIRLRRQKIPRGLP